MISSDRGWYAGRRLPLHRAGGVAIDPQKNRVIVGIFANPFVRWLSFWQKLTQSSNFVTLFYRSFLFEVFDTWTDAKVGLKTCKVIQTKPPKPFFIWKKHISSVTTHFSLRKHAFFSIPGRRLWAEWLVLDIQGVLDERRWWTSMGFEGFPKLSDLVICGWCCCFGLMVIQFYIGH